MSICVSVILCTHNPRRDYLVRVLNGLRAQTLDVATWELLLIDNASEKPLDVDVAGRIVREDAVGLVHARRRGIAEARGELLVFVDDDNVLEPDYLAHAIRIAGEHEKLGVFGGNVEPKFEVEPPIWTTPYWPFLAIRHVKEDRRSLRADDYDAMPCGAGMCVRASVARRWVELLDDNPARLGLGRTGERLLSGEDSDLAATAIDMGLECGVFTSLRLAHLIPPRRLEESYLRKLVEGTHYSNLRLRALRDTLPTPNIPREWLAIGKAALAGPRAAKFKYAAYRGRRAAYRDVVGRMSLPPLPSEPVVTIITPSFNQAAFLERTIRSVLAQDHPHIEYVVMDGGSTDGSVEIIRQHEERLAAWLSEPDQGQADAISRGFARMSGHILAWLNSDDVLAPSAVRIAVDAFRRNPHAGVVYGDRLHIDARDNVIGINRMPSFHAKMFRRNITLPQECVFFRRDAYERVGGITPGLRFSLDFDLWVRLAHVTNLHHVPAFLGSFREHGESKSVTFHATGNSEADKYLGEHEQVYAKHFNKPLPGPLAMRLYRLWHKGRLAIERNSAAYRAEVAHARSLGMQPTDRREPVATGVTA